MCGICGWIDYRHDLGSDEHARTLAAMNRTMGCRGPDQEGIWTGGPAALCHRRLAVIDATNVRQSSRKPLIAIARRHSRPTVAIVLAVPLDVCLSRVDLRRDRIVPVDAVRRQHALLTAGLGGLDDEGFDRVYVLRTQSDIDAAHVTRV